MSNRFITFGLVMVFLFLASLIVGVGELGLHAMNEQNFEARNIRAQQWKDVQLASEVLEYLNRNNQINMLLFLSDDSSELDSLIAERTENVARVTALLGTLSTRIDSTEEQGCFDAVLASRKPYTASYQYATKLLLMGKKAEARRFMIQDTMPHLQIYRSALRDYANFQTREMNEQLETTTSRYRIVHKEVIALMILSVVVALSIAAFVIRRIMLEMRHREEAENGLRQLNAELEIKVLKRTESLVESKRNLTLEIEERKRKEAQVHRLSTAVEQSPASVVITDLSGRIVYVNRKFLECTGYSLDEAMGQNPRILKSGRTKPEEYEQLWQTITAGKEWRGEFCNRKKNGDLYWEHAVICSIRDDNSRISHFLAIKEDITERRRAEKELLLTKFSLENASDAVLWIDKHGRIVYANEAACRSLKRSRDELVSLSIPDIDPLVSPHAWAALWENLKARGSITLESQHKDKDGRIFPVEVTANYLYFDGEVYSFAFTRDISERRRMQAQLQQVQKMESIGQLAAGIAHEINTPTQFVSDNLTFLGDSCKSVKELVELYRRAIRDNSGALSQGLVNTIHQAERSCDVDFIMAEVTRAIDQSLDGTRRVAEIVRAMKTFSHPDSVDKTATDLNNAIQSTITVARNEWKYVADVVTELDDTLPLVVCYPGDMNQVILNLLVNAAHAINDKVKSEVKGRIEVRTRRHDKFVEISIADTGTGIPEGIRSKIFDPFFTTKEIGKGTGQGLSIAYAIIVKKHAGKLSFETQTGVGTTFFIEIPIE